MVVYLIVIFALFLCVMLSCVRMPISVKDILYWTCAAGLIILSAIRDFSVGTDTLNYCWGYRYIRQLSFEEAMNFRWEQGYVAVNWLLGQVIENQRALLILMALMILLPLFAWMKRESKWPILSLVIFVGMGMWNSSMFILRQWCAMSILTYSYKYIKERKFIRFLIVVLIAMLFHRTAAVFLLAYFVQDIPLNKNVILFSIPVSVVVGVFGGKILNILNHFARISEEKSFNGGGAMLAVLWLCIIAVLICFKGKIPSELDFYTRFIYLAALLQPIAFTFSNWARIITYFTVSLSVFLPGFVVELTGENTKNVKFRIPVGVLVCVLMLVWFRSVGADAYVFMK